MVPLKLGYEMKGFPTGIDWSLVLNRVAIEDECGEPYTKEHFFSTFAHTQYGFDFKINSDSKVLFFESFNGRNNFVEYVNTLSSLITSDTVIEKRGNRTVDIIRGFKYCLYYYPSWRKVIKKAGLGSVFEKLSLYYLLNIHRFYNELKKTISERRIDLKQYNLFVTFYDSIPKDAFFVQLMHHYGVKTATLQHGAFTAKRNTELVNSGVELRTLNSDYFLCWNKFTVDEAIKEGFDQKKCKITGIIGFAKNHKRIVCEEVSNNVFGVVIGHPTFEKENNILIESANLLSQKTGKDYYLKLHPNYSESYFDDIVDKQHYRGLIKKGIPMLEYANSVDFSIVGASTVFVELVYLGHKVLRYSSGEIVDKWRDIKVGNHFSSPKGVVDAFDNLNSQKNDQELFDYLCTVEDVRSSYQEFFEKFLY